MKKIKMFILLFIISIMSVINVGAISIDTSKICSIEGIYNFSDKVLSDANVSLYKIANMASDNKFSYLNNYQKFDLDINNYSSSKWEDYARSINDYILDNSISSDFSSKTDNNGKFSFKDLTTGLYLVIIDSIEDGNYRYSSSPVLISIPNYNQIDGHYMYDVSVVMKTEALDISIKAPQDNNDNTTSSPNTYDAIFKYIVLFVIALVVFIGMVCYIYKKRKDVKRNEKEKSNEKNN